MVRDLHLVIGWLPYIIHIILHKPFSNFHTLFHKCLNHKTQDTLTHVNFDHVKADKARKAAMTEATLARFARQQVEQHG